jgi:hypothetical protein
LGDPERDETHGGYFVLYFLFSYRVFGNQYVMKNKEFCLKIRKDKRNASK